MDHFPIPTFPPDEWVWVRLRKICVEYKGQKEKVARSPSPHSIFFYVFLLASYFWSLPLHSCQWDLDQTPWETDPLWIFPHFSACEWFQNSLWGSPPLLCYILLFLLPSIFYLFLARHWFLPLIGDFSLFIICYSTLKVLSWLEGIFHRGSMEYIFCTWIWVCVIEMTFYKL